MRKRSAGLSLLECLVAAAILSVVGIAVMGAMAQGAREVDTTSDYTIALLLSQKVLEESLAAMDVDAHADRKLMTQSGTRRSVTAADNPFFSVVEDTAQPYGRLEVGKDQGVQPSDEALFRLYREFTMGLDVTERSVEELTGAPKHLLELDVTFEVPAGKDKARAFRISNTMARPMIAARAKPWIAQDADRLDAAIVKQMYPTRQGQSLSTVVGAVGGNLAAVRDLGSILTATEYALLSLRAVDGQVKTIQTQLAAMPGSGPDPARHTLLVRLGKIEERAASIAWKVLLFAKDPARRLSTTIAADQVGGAQTMATTSVAGVAAQTLLMSAVLKVHAARSLAAFHEARAALPPQDTRAFRQFCLERKILELAQLRVLLSGTPDMAFVIGWLDYMREQYRGRNQAVEAYVGVERGGADSADALRTLHPEVAARVEETAVADTALRQMAQRIGPPPGGVLLAPPTNGDPAAPRPGTVIDPATGRPVGP